MSEVDARCSCDRCERRTKETYSLTARCRNCASSFTAKMRRGDKRPLMVDCPVCGVYDSPLWGGMP